MKIKEVISVVFFSLVLVAVLNCDDVTGPANHELLFQPGPEVGKDAYVRSWPWYIHFNYGDDDRLSILWKHITSEDFAWSYVEFVELDPYVGSGYECLSATLSLFWISGNPAPVPWLYVFRAAGPWEEDTLTWDNQPGYTGNPCIFDGALPESPEWVNIDVTEIVSGWFSGEYEHRGFVIKLADTTSECYERFYSSDNYHDEKPKLYIEYK